MDKTTAKITIDSHRLPAETGFFCTDKKSKQPPVIDGYLKPGTSQIFAWCGHCERYHIHGAPDGQAADYEHRVAHCCAPGSPYDRIGYMINVHRCAPPKRRQRRAHYPRR